LPESETEEERVTRNWNELLQELRVTQTGIQILTGFLLTVPFSDRFSDLDSLQRDTYLIVLCGAVITTGLVLAPVAYHRILFRQRMKPWLVEASHRSAQAGLFTLGLTVSGVVFLVFDLVIDRGASLAALVVAAVFFSVLWAVVPVMKDRNVSDDDP
jgi:hypothetical protein